MTPPLLDPESLHIALADSGAQVLDLFEAPEASLTNAYAPDKWTARMILVHLADVEMVHLWRISRAIAEPGVPVAAFDENAWAARLAYATRSLAAARLVFEGGRMQLLDHLERLTVSELAQTVTHSERGPLSVHQLYQSLADHTTHHLEQINAARENRVWTPKS
jgi:predicted metal-dependent phosphoesterase TrpH